MQTVLPLEKGEAEGDGGKGELGWEAPPAYHEDLLVS